MTETPWTPGHIDIVFDGPPAHESGRFVEVENEQEASIGLGTWIDRGNGFWALRIPCNNDLIALAPEMAAAILAMGRCRQIGHQSCECDAVIYALSDKLLQIGASDE